MRYDAVIFDKDGVLLNSMNDDFEWADKMRIELARNRGVEMTQEDALNIVKAGTVKEIEEIAEKIGLDIETIQEIEKEIAERKIEKIRKGDINLFKETEKVLTKLELPKSIVSNAPYRATKFTVENFGIEKHFQAVLSPRLDDVREYSRLKKPNPEMLEKAIKEMDASNPVMIGDSDDDIMAAKNAGIDSIFVDMNGGTDLDPTHRVRRLKHVLDIIN